MLLSNPLPPMQISTAPRAAAWALLLLIASGTLSVASDVIFFVPPSQALPNPRVALSDDTHATLTTAGHNVRTAPLTVTGSFVFRNVSAGSYLVDVQSHSHAFVPMRLDVHAGEGDDNQKNGLSGRKEAQQHATAEIDEIARLQQRAQAVGQSEEVEVKSTVAHAQMETGVQQQRQRTRTWITFRGNDWDNKGEELTLTSRGFEVRCLGPKNYFIEREGFSILSILKNPTMLIAIATLFMVFGMPKIIDSMDPELRAEWEEHQKKNPMSSLMGGATQSPGTNFDLAAFLSGSDKQKQASSGTNSGGSSNAGGKKSGPR